MENREVTVTEFKENPDGSATVTFDFNDDEIVSFFRLGVIQAIKAGIAEAQQYNPENTNRKSRKHTLEVEWEQVDAIVIKELQDTYVTNRNGTDEYDVKLTEALDVVLRHFMIFSEYEDWKNGL